MRIENSQLGAFTDQMFHQFHHGTFAQVVRVFFERQPHNSDFLRPDPEHRVNRPIELLLIAWKR